MSGLVTIITLACLSLGLQASIPPDLQQLSDGNTDFGFDLYHKIRDLQKPENIFISPWSVSTALAMLYAGASGRTKSQMAEVLKFKNIQDVHRKFKDLTQRVFNQPQGTYPLKQANKLYGATGFSFKDSFLRTLESAYKSPLERKDFSRRPGQSRQEINTWVEDQTEDKIKDLLPLGSVDTNTALVLVNALYFKADWKTAFNPSSTRPINFYIKQNPGGNDEYTTVPMMVWGKAKVMYTHNEIAKYQMLELPYSDERMSMFIILPDERFGIDGVTEYLSADNIRSDVTLLENSTVNIHLPKIKIRTRFELRRMLVQLGMIDAFGAADFREMTDGVIMLGEVYHQAFVDVNEQGTEAAAATAVVASRMRSPSIKTFRVDHPFIFFIRENSTGSILFMGKIGKPETTA